jgi:hypothetical protein
MSENKQKKPAKKWTVPQLIVLARGKPEERVLEGCKQSYSLVGADNHNSACLMMSPNNCDCVTACYSWSDS